MNGHPFIPSELSAKSAVQSQWFFSDPEARRRLLASFEKWDRTAWSEGSKAPGPTGGIDCVGFLEVTMFEAAAAPRFAFPRSHSDFRGHLHNTKILRYFRGQNDDPQSAMLAHIFAELTNIDELVPKPSWPDNRVLTTGLMCGDICVVKAITPGVWHLPIMRDDRMFLHCASPLGVTEGDITQEDFRGRIKAIFRARAIAS